MASVTSLLTGGGLVLPHWTHGLHEPPSEGETETDSRTAPYRVPATTCPELVPQNLYLNPSLTAFLQQEMSRIFADTADRPDLDADAGISIEHMWKVVERAAVNRSGWKGTHISYVLQVACEVVVGTRSSVGRLRPGPAARSGPATDDRSSWVIDTEMWAQREEAKTEGVRPFHFPQFSHGPSS